MNQLVLVALCVMSLNGVFSLNQIFLTNQDTYYPSYTQRNIVPNQIKVDFLNLPGIDFPQRVVYASSANAGPDPIWTDNINQFPLTYQTNGLSFVSPASNIDQHPVQHQHLPFGHGNQRRLHFIKNGLQKLRNHQAIGQRVQQIQHGFQNPMNPQVLDQRVQRIQNDHQNPMSSQVLDQGVEPMTDFAAIQPADNPLNQPEIPNLAKNSVNKQPDYGTIAKSLNFKPKETIQESLQTQYVTKTQPSIGKSGLKSKPVEIDRNLHDKSAINSKAMVSNIQQQNHTMNANDASYQRQLQQEQQLVDLIRQEQDKLLRIKLQQAEIKIKQEELIRNQIAGSQKPMGQMERNLPMHQSMQQNTPVKQSMQQNTPMQQKKQSRQRFGKSQTSIQRLGQQTPISSQNQQNTQQQQNSPTLQQIQQMQSRRQPMIQQRQIQQLQQRFLEQMRRQQLLDQQQSLNIKRERLQKTIKDRQSLQNGRYKRRRQLIKPINFLP